MTYHVLTLFAVPSHESCAAGTLPGDVVTVSSILTLADQGTVLAIEAQRASCVRTENSRSQKATEEKPSSCLHAFVDELEGLSDTVQE